MVSYKQLNVGDPLALVFEARGMKWIAGIVAISAVIATASVLLVFQLGQPRIWMSMSRDGLLPKIFSRIHPRFGTPSFSTILTGLVVAIPALFLNLDVVLALTSIGTLFAFVLVCGGVLVLQTQKDKPESKFKVPYINGKFIMPLLLIIATFVGFKYNNNSMNEFFKNKTLVAKEDLYDRLGGNDSTTLKANLPALDTSFLKYNGNIKSYLEESYTTVYRPFIRNGSIMMWHTSSTVQIPQWM